MLGNWQILKTETYQVVGWFYAGQLADSENRNISLIRWLDGSMLGNWQMGMLAVPVDGQAGCTY
jgi:hypothetical protein